MYVEFNILQIYFLSDISLVLRPIKFRCVLVWVLVPKDFLNCLFSISISPGLSIRWVEFVLT